MEQKSLRKEVVYEKKIVPAIEDELAFIENKCSKHARKVVAEFQDIELELWFDKHYHNREQHGDNSGKRIGIDNHIVESLVLRSFNHLLFYGAVIKGFTFLNHPGIATGSARVVLQEFINGTMLNVVIEVHLINIYKYEVTVKTAMAIDGFRIADGQYAIELQGDSSFLKKKEKGKFKEILSI